MPDKKVGKNFLKKKTTTISIWQAIEKIVECIRQIEKIDIFSI